MQWRASSSAWLGAPGELGELVSCVTTVEHDGGSLVSFVGRVISSRGKSLAHLCDRDLVLDIDGGPALRVTIVRLEGHDAILQLASPG